MQISSHILKPPKALSPSRIKVQNGPWDFSGACFPASLSGSGTWFFCVPCFDNCPVSVRKKLKSLLCLWPLLLFLLVNLFLACLSSSAFSLLSKTCSNTNTHRTLQTLPPSNFDFSPNTCYFLIHHWFLIILNFSILEQTLGEWRIMELYFLYYIFD